MICHKCRINAARVYETPTATSVHEWVCCECLNVLLKKDIESLKLKIDHLKSFMSNWEGEAWWNGEYIDDINAYFEDSIRELEQRIRQ